MGQLTLMDRKAAASRFGELSPELTQQGLIYTGAYREIDHARAEAKDQLLEAIASGALQTIAWTGEIKAPGAPKALWEAFPKLERQARVERILLSAAAFEDAELGRRLWIIRSEPGSGGLARSGLWGEDPERGLIELEFLTRAWPEMMDYCKQMSDPGFAERLSAIGQREEMERELPKASASGLGGSRL